jgi:DNA-binding NarL/FixJ family response regulator
MKSYAGTAVRTVLAFGDQLAIPVKLHAALETDREFKLLRVSCNHADIVRLATEHQPDVTLFWFRTNADLVILEELRRVAPDSALVLCIQRDVTPETARQAVALGARAFLSASAGWPTFKECLRLSTENQRTPAGFHAMGAQ